MATLALDKDRKSAPLRIRLTRRGWVVLVGLPVFLLALALSFLVPMFTSTAQASAQEPAGIQTVEVTVVPGDTLWGLAREYATGYDVESAIRHIGELNSLDASVLYAGQTLDIPQLAH